MTYLCLCTAAEEISAAACDDKPNRLAVGRLYNDMCKIIEENTVDSVETYIANKPASFKLKKNLQPLELIHQEIIKTISPVIKTEKRNGDVATSSPHQHEPGPVNGTATADVYEEYKLTVTSYFPNCVYEDLTLMSDDCKITSITKLSLLAHIKQLLHCVLLTYNYGTVVRCNRSHVVKYMFTNLYLVEPEFACFTRTVVAGYTRVNWVDRK
ncbi:hypothetical protein HanOQP8_Chr01g0034401 [Helianthus annuus]|nr:hypothetical protein HanOQP8_Chr01g0034401 [Helianthus annuus]